MTVMGGEDVMVRRPLREEETAFVREARVGRLATVDDRGRPAVVPFCFAIVGGDAPVAVSVLDEKPKRVADRALARVRNITAHPEVAFVVDRYDEDWTRLAWVQVKGRARLVAPDEDGHAAAIVALRAKYPQYRAMAIEDRLVIAIEHLRASSWRGDGGAFS
jgi:PPOX class probable F420-dependent enzyme